MMLKNNNAVSVPASRRCCMRHSLQITTNKTDSLNGASAVCQSVMSRIMTILTSADLTGFMLFFGTNILTVKQAWVKETGNS
jgi:ABC-type iron transport system FetAB ATPase subunit